MPKPITNPYKITGRSVISFSGGRTSAYMLYQTLQAYNGQLPADMHVAFCNTGREMEPTLEFVHECGENWNVPITWLEYRRVNDENTFVEVTFGTASRNGEPFEQAMTTRNILPNPRARYCTDEMKVMTLHRWLCSLYGPKQITTHMVGLRADEPKRVVRLQDPDNLASKPIGLRSKIAPLFYAGVTKEDVMAFWKGQNFDLRLKGDWEGNCDGCFLKRSTAIRRLAADYPERMQWWADQEAKYKATEAAKAEVEERDGGRGDRFRIDWRGGYKELIRKGQPSVFFRDDDDGGDVMLECEGGCGV